MPPSSQCHFVFLASQNSGRAGSIRLPAWLVEVRQFGTSLFHAVSCCFSLQRSGAVLRLFERAETGPPWTTKPQRIQDIQVQYDPTQIPDGTYTPDTVYLFSYVGPRLKIARNPNT